MFGMSEMLITDKSNVFENYVVFTIVTYIYFLIKSLKIVYSKKEYDKDSERY
jgi:CDP-glycerol glycerophosphotransferase (TagB/SpsB family)